MEYFFRRGLMLALCVLVWANGAVAAPYAALVMDARTGKVLHARNHDTRLHPASLTKMMTLYVAFLAVERGEIRLDTKVRISKHAAAQPASKLGLRAGQRIEFRYLIRAAAVKSANDAATAIGEAISGSEAAFAQRMTATAKAMGMSRTTFRNAHGLTRKGHLSTARDMANLGRRLFYDYPDYYHLFSRITTQTGGKTVYNTNRRFLRAYRGADGIKTGYTRAAGYNLVGSARRGNVRIIASLFGGKSTPWRNARMAQLLDMGFARAPSRARTVKPSPLGTISSGTALVASNNGRNTPVRLHTGISAAAPPMPRPRSGRDAGDEEIGALIARAVMDEEIKEAVQETVLSPSTASRMTLPRPYLRPSGLAGASLANLDGSSATAHERAIIAPPKDVAVIPVGAKSWSVHLGSYSRRVEAERLLLQTALSDVSALNGAMRKIEPGHDKGRRVYNAQFVGLTKVDAERACARLIARNETCVTVSPGT